jgi:hypothetical protein
VPARGLDRGGHQILKERAVMSVTTATRPTPTSIAACDFVENGPLRREVERLVDLEIWTWRGLAAELGVNERGLAISLGHQVAPGQPPSRYVRYERAVEIARLVGLEPVDAGL